MQVSRLLKGFARVLELPSPPFPGIFDKPDGNPQGHSNYDAETTCHGAGHESDNRQKIQRRSKFDKRLIERGDLVFGPPDLPRIISKPEKGTLFDLFQIARERQIQHSLEII